MLKINYPSIAKDKIIFEDTYYSFLNSFDAVAINTHLSNISYKRSVLTFEVLVKLSFDELIDIEPTILKYSQTFDRYVTWKGKQVLVNDFKELFNYKKNQPSIATFFMQQECFKLSVCHYCGIDYVNAFSDIEDYQDGKDFINRAKPKDLKYIKGIGYVTAKKIIKNRPYSDINKISCSKTIKKALNDFTINNSHNHFTLDHLLPQKTHSFYSLCLHNLVPSCYSCNSKFKGALNFKINNQLKNISPTSSSYSLSKDFRFRIFYPNIQFNNIKDVSEFTLDRNVLRNKAHLDTYFEMFKIGGRYTYQKSQILELIENKINYPPSRIKEISKQTGISIKKLNKNIFGNELFDSKLSSSPMIKLKRDIAKKLNIKGVI